MNRSIMRHKRPVFWMSILTAGAAIFVPELTARGNELYAASTTES